MRSASSSHACVRLISCALPLRAASWCEKASLAFCGFTRSAVLTTRFLLGAVLAPSNTCPPQHLRSNAVTAALKNAALSRREMLAHVDTSNARHDSITSPNHVQPNRKRSTSGLIPHDTRNPRASLQLLPVRCGSRFATACTRGTTLPEGPERPPYSRCPPSRSAARKPPHYEDQKAAR